MAMNVNDLKGRASDLIDQASDVTEDLGAKAKPYVDRATEAAKPLVDKAKPVVDRASQQAGVIAEKARPHVDKAIETVGDLTEKAKPHVDQAKVAATDLAGKAKPHAERARDWAASILDKAFDFLEEQTGTDLDGDGVVGAAVKQALEISVEDDAPEGAAVSGEVPAIVGAEDEDEPDIEIPDVVASANMPDEVEVIGEEL